MFRSFERTSCGYSQTQERGSPQCQGPPPSRDPAQVYRRQIEQGGVQVDLQHHGSGIDDLLAGELGPCVASHENKSSFFAVMNAIFKSPGSAGGSRGRSVTPPRPPRRSTGLWKRWSWLFLSENEIARKSYESSCKLLAPSDIPRSRSGLPLVIIHRAPTQWPRSCMQGCPSLQC